MPASHKSAGPAYEVGYGKPPVASRFTKGQSGNPSGRPKGRKNLATVLSQALQRKVAVNDNGRRRMISVFEAAVTQVVNKAATGDARAFEVILRMQPFLADNSSEQLTPDREMDLQHAQRIAARLLAAGAEGHGKKGQDHGDAQ